MADYCKQCSEEIFGHDFEDHANITHRADTEAGQYATVICEGCGPTQVDHEGGCIHHENDDPEFGCLVGCPPDDDDED